MAVNENETINIVLAERDVGKVCLAKRLAKRLKHREEGQIGQQLEAGEAPILVVGRGVSPFRKSGQASLAKR